MTWPAARRIFSAFSLSSIVKVEHSAMMRGGSFAAAISFAVAISASGFGRLVMMIGAAAATALASRTISTPALANSLRLPASMSKPTTRHPAATQIAGERAAHDAEPDHAHRLVRFSPGSFRNSP